LGQAFYICGGFIVLISLEMVYGIKDIKLKAKSKSIFAQLKIGYNESKSKIEIPIAIMTYCIASVANLVSS